MHVVLTVFTSLNVQLARIQKLDTAGHQEQPEAERKFYVGLQEVEMCDIIGGGGGIICLDTV